MPIAMQVEVWQDYICPWAYLGRHRSDVLRELGFEVIQRPFELHPETPREPVPVRSGGRFDRVLARIAAECAELGIAFTPPRSTPNSRAALALAETVRVTAPQRFRALDDALFAARFVHGADLSDAGVLRDALRSVGLDPGLLDADPSGTKALDASMARARDLGIAATPAWRFANGFVVPGVHAAETMRRWATRMIERSEPTGRIDLDG